MPLDRTPGVFRVQPIAGQQHALGAPHHLRHLLHPGPMGQRRKDQRRILLRRAWHQVAEMVGQDESHLAVRQHRAFGRPVVPEVKNSQHGSS